MKLLLTMNLPYYPPFGGANKGNRDMLEGLAKSGHLVRAVVSALGTPSRLTHEQFLDELSHLRIQVFPDSWGDIFTLNGVEVHAVIDPSQMRTNLVSQIREFDPDWILVSSEDPSQNLLDAAMKSHPERVAYLARTTSFLPFGPQAFFPSQGRTEIFKRVPLIITLSQFVAEYIRHWSGIESTVVPLSFFGPGPFPNFGQFDRGFVTMVNPCAVKGLSIFLSLARRMTDIQFAAVPTWGTTEADLASLEQLPNVRILNPEEEIDEIFAQTRILLMPSLWAEAYGQIVVEAMLRGIPVLASNIGGLPEAKLGTDYLLPVCPIERFEKQLDGNWIPVSVVPEQDIEPWYNALNGLLSNRDLYENQSKASRDASLQFVSNLSLEPLEGILTRRMVKAPTTDKSFSEGFGRPEGQHLPGGIKNRGSLFEEVAQLTPKQLALLSLRLKKKATANNEHTPLGPPRILPVLRDGPLPLSFAQERLWFLDQLTPNSAAYNVPVAMCMRGQLNFVALEQSLNEVVRRHESLRTTFSQVDGQLVQVIAPAAWSPLSIVDLRGLDNAERHLAKESLVTTETKAPFDLKHGPLFRAKLIQLDDHEYIAIFVTHHMISDGWSMQVFLGELTAMYGAFSQSRQPPLPQLPIQYVDFASWQREWLQGEVLQNELEYWKQQLSGAPPVLDLPTDRPRPMVRSLGGALCYFDLSSALSNSIKALSRSEGATLYMTLLAAFKTLLCRYTGQGDIVVGSSFTGRDRIELEVLIGFFANTLVLRTRLSNNINFKQVLSQLRETIADAFTHQHLPFEKLVEELQPERNMRYPPLFQVMLHFDDVAPLAPQIPDLSVTSLAVDTGTVGFDLALSMLGRDGGISGCLTYNTDIYDESTIQRLLRHFETLLCSIVTNPDARVSSLPLLSDAESYQLVVEWNQTQIAFPQSRALHHLIEAQVDRTPDSIAVSFEDQSLSYGQLNRRANQLAHYLQCQGIELETPVALYLERSLEMVIALLGTLKAGGAYLPLDTESPAQRLAFMLDDAGVGALLTQDHLYERLPQCETRVMYLDRDWPGIAGYPENNPRAEAPGENAAYLIYTSGSTGQPKCAVNSHAGICNRLQWMQQAYQLRGDDRVLQKTPYSFDVSVWEFFWPLMEGACLVVARPGGNRESGYLVRLIGEENITVVHFVPSMLQLFLEEPKLEECKNLRYVICSGEALSVELKDRYLKQLGAGLHNLYGPTEAAVDVTSWSCEQESGGNSAPIGKPIANLQVYVLDRQMGPAPIGVAGELFIGGVGVGRGYLKRAALTAEKFIPDPFTNEPGKRLYETGDLARRLPDGNLEFLGRLDHQVKLRGQRVELGEIETVLKKHPAVSEAVVIAQRDDLGDQRLVAYVVAREQMEALSREMRDFLRERLPEYMAPAVFVTLDQLPLTTNGKLDRLALPLVDKSINQSEAAFIAPRDGLEVQLAILWEDFLGVTRVGIKDDFFILGGHSLLAVRLVNEIQKIHGIALPLGTLFGGPTIENIAKIIRHQTQSTTTSSLVAIQPRGDRRPFYCVHPLGGGVACYYELANYMGKNQPFYGLQSPGWDWKQKPFTELGVMAERYLNDIRGFQPNGPYLLGGWSMGATVAYEMAQQLHRQGQEVAFLALMDNGKMSSRKPEKIDDAEILVNMCASVDISLSLDDLRRLSADEQLDYATHRVEIAGLASNGMGKSYLRQFLAIYKAHMQASQSYDPRPYPGPVTIFRTNERGVDNDLDSDWETLAPGGFKIYKIQGDHLSMIRAPHVQTLANQLIDCLDEAHSRIGGAMREVGAARSSQTSRVGGGTQLLPDSNGRDDSGGTVFRL
jgi:amino acid adenylation domain-containing protein